MRQTTILLSVLAIALLVAACGQTTPAQQDTAQAPNVDIPTEPVAQPEIEEDDAMEENMEMPEDAEPASGPDVTFVLTGENFKFVMDGEENPELRVQQGDLVRIEFTSSSGFHDWVVDEFGAATEKVQTDGSSFVEFVADQAGTFEYYCSVGSHRANGMKGNMVVEE